MQTVTGAPLPCDAPHHNEGVLSVIKLVLNNTVKFQEKGLDQWYRHGLHHLQTQSAPNHLVLCPEVSDPASMYSASVGASTAFEMFQSIAGSLNEGAVDKTSDCFRKIYDKMLRYGTQESSGNEALDHECGELFLTHQLSNFTLKE
jgi:hypothetical protein